MNTAWLIIAFQYLSLAHRKFYNFMHLFLIAMLRVIDILKFLCYPSLNLPNFGSHQNIAKNSKLSRNICVQVFKIGWYQLVYPMQLGQAWLQFCPAVINWPAIYAAARKVPKYQCVKTVFFMPDNSLPSFAPAQSYPNVTGTKSTPNHV